MKKVEKAVNRSFFEILEMAKVEKVEKPGGKGGEFCHLYRIGHVHDWAAHGYFLSE